MSKKFEENEIRALAEKIGQIVPENYDFTIITFKKGNQMSQVNYITSANKEDKMKSIKCLMDKWEKENKELFKLNMN